MQNIVAAKYKDTKIILASGSPRRKELLKGLDLIFVVETKDIEEIFPKDLKENEITEYLAKLKSDAFLPIQDKTLIITADTIVWLDGKPIMKPVDYEDAVKILKTLSGKEHIVYTSVCIRTNTNEKVFTETTKVYFNELLDQEIEYYIKHYPPFDKAGAYGAQDWIGFVAVNKIEGSYFNVMGLPIHRLYSELLAFDLT